MRCGGRCRGVLLVAWALEKVLQPAGEHICILGNNYVLCEHVRQDEDIVEQFPSSGKNPLFGETSFVDGLVGGTTSSKF